MPPAVSPPLRFDCLLGQSSDAAIFLAARVAILFESANTQFAGQARTSCNPARQFAHSREQFAAHGAWGPTMAAHGQRGRNYPRTGWHPVIRAPAESARKTKRASRRTPVARAKS